MSFELDRTSWRVWLVIALLTLLFHGALLLTRPLWILAPAPKRYAVDTITPKQLQDIRNRWNEREKQQSLLVPKNQPKDQQAPKDARYFSDRNIRVEKEMRAHRGNEGKTHPRSAPEHSQSRAREQNLNHSRLGNLGVALPKPALPKSAAPEQPSGLSSRFEGDADQQVLEKDLPQGAENLLNAQRSVYYSFFARMDEAIEPIWRSLVRDALTRMEQDHHPLASRSYLTVLQLVLDRDGNLVEIRSVESSGASELDRCARAAFHRVGKFPNPPKPLLKDGQIVIPYGFEVDLAPSTGIQLDFQSPLDHDWP